MGGGARGEYMVAKTLSAGRRFYHRVHRVKVRSQRRSSGFMIIIMIEGKLFSIIPIIKRLWAAGQLCGC